MNYFFRTLFLFRALSLIILFIPSAHAFLDNWKVEFYNPFAESRPVFATMFTAGRQNINKADTVYLQPDVQKTYINNDTNQSILSAGIFLGAHNILSDWLEGQLGVAYVVAKNSHIKNADISGETFNVTGDVLEDSDPDFNNFNFQYQLQHERVMAKLRLIGRNPVLSVLPYVEASAGAAFNNAKNFVYTPKIDEEVAPPAFKNNRETSFAYTLGIGFEAVINDNIRAALGYQFADWGKSQLGPACNCQTINQGVTINHLYTNSAQLTLTLIL